MLVPISSGKDSMFPIAHKEFKQINQSVAFISQHYSKRVTGVNRGHNFTDPMALSVQKASSSNSSSKSTPKWKFHVFLSFRGEDTRKSFTDHLYSALCRKGLKIFRDDEELERGEVISEKLLKAIEDSLFAIVVLSKNYAFSSWCLDELQKILKSRDELGQQVLPIFYGVDPSDIRHQKGSFAEAFAKHEFKQDQEKVQKWRDSLTKVANLSGWDSKNWHEAELIERVVEVLWTSLRCKLPSYSDTIIGIDWRVHEMESHLGIGLDDVRFVGIWGMGGIGKTTLARVVYERFHNQFDFCYFLANVREVSEREGEVHLQRKLLSNFKIRNMEIDDTYEGKNIILNLCCFKKVLLILDDVSSISQLQNLAGSQEWFGVGSRVIITTRDVHLLISHRVHEIYEVKTMNKDESLQLFSQKAFRRDYPGEGFLELSKSMLEYAGGLPLALHVMGSFLCERNVLQWEDTLDKFKRVPNKDILKILRISYDALDDAEKTIFLDIACFFKGWSKYEVTQILKNCGFNSTIGISILIEKSLLYDGIYLEMHDLLQQMGRNIVFEESPNDVGKRSRLWSEEDIDEVLKKNMGTKVIQGMMLHIKKPYEAHWDPKAFSDMFNLRLLIISRNLRLPCGLTCLPSALKVLRWCEYPLETLPFGTQLDKLVDLEMHHSKIKELWNEGQCLENLKFLDLSHSKYLIKTPNFFGLPNLERLELEGCVDLVELHPPLGQHKKLQVLNLKGCKNLKALPTKLEMTSLKEFVLEETGIEEIPTSFGFLTNVEVLNLKGCKNLKVLPKKLEMNSLKEIVLEETGIEEVPASLGFLTNVEVLNLRGCKNLKVLPIKLETTSLKEFVLEQTSIEEVPASLGFLTNVEVLNLRGCKNLKVLPRKLEMNSLKEFVLCGCTQVRNLPKFGENMKNLVTLDVEETGLVKLPESLGLLTSLEALNLRGCKNLVCLPHNIHNLKHLKILDISGCSKFSRLPENLNENEALEKLDASGTAITEVPSSICYLEKLKTLSFHGCEGPMSNSWILPHPLNHMFQRHSFPKGLIMPTSIFNLKSLTQLDLSYCNINDGSIPDDLSGLSSLWKLDLSGNKFVNLPAGCMSNLLKLQLLYLNFCPRLQSLPQASPNLDTMNAKDCASFETLSGEQLLHLLGSIDQPGQCPKWWNVHNKYFSATIPGSEIPSWFKNQDHLSLNEKSEASIIIDVPPCEWFGIVLCTVLDDMFYSTEANQEIFRPPCWFFHLTKAFDGKFEPIVGRERVLEEEIKSPHLWIVFEQIRETNGYELSRNYSQLHMTFFYECEERKLTLDGIVSIKCGWHVIRKGDFEKWNKSMRESQLPILEEHKDGGMCSEAEEQGQCSLSLSEGSQTIINEYEILSPKASSSCLEDEGKLDDSCMQFITGDASHRDFALPTATPPTAVQSPTSSNRQRCQPSETANTQVARICIDDSIDGTQLMKYPEQNLSRKRNRSGDTLVANTISKAYKSGTEKTSAENIFAELSEVSDLEDTELLQIYDVLTSDERKYESFKALPTRLRKSWILMQIKK